MLGNPLRVLLDLPEQEKIERGLEHTPRASHTIIQLELGYVRAEEQEPSRK